MNRLPMLPNNTRLLSRVIPLLFAVVLIYAAFPGSSAASDIRVFSSVSSNNVTVGERFTLNVEIRSREPHNVERPELPELTGMRYLSTVPRTSTSYSLVNGVAQMTYRYSYTVEATDSGAYHIPPVYLKIDNSEYETAPVTVVIRDSDRAAPDRPVADRTDRPSIYLELELSEERPVRGQQIVAEIVLYFRNTIDINTFNVTRSWQTEGFWREDLSQSQTRQAETVILDGVSYRRAVLTRYALFPTRSGELIIPSYAIRVSVRQSGRFRDEYSSFFDGFNRQRTVDLESPPRTLLVHAPPIPPPNGQLISALGQFTVERTLSDNRIALGEAVEVITEIRGSGNLGLITRPFYQYPGIFDTHRPREVIERDETAPRMSGTKQFRDVLIARNAGRFTIPNDTILIYDDARRRYVAHVLPELSIEVIRDPNARVTMAQSDAFRLNPVRGSVIWSKDTRVHFYLTWWFWFALVIPLMLLVLGFRSYRYHQKLKGDASFSRYERAYHYSISMLDEAGNIAASTPDQDDKAVYSTIYKAISNFITARLQLPDAGLTEEQLTNELQKRNVESPLCDRVYKLLTKCATIRYAPDPTPGDIGEDLAEARKLLSELRLQL